VVNRVKSTKTISVTLFCTKPSSMYWYNSLNCRGCYVYNCPGLKLFFPVISTLSTWFLYGLWLFVCITCSYDITKVWIYSFWDIWGIFRVLLMLLLSILSKILVQRFIVNTRKRITVASVWFSLSDIFICSIMILSFSNSYSIQRGWSYVISTELFVFGFYPRLAI